MIIFCAATNCHKFLQNWLPPGKECVWHFDGGALSCSIILQISPSSVGRANFAKKSGFRTCSATVARVSRLYQQHHHHHHHHQQQHRHRHHHRVLRHMYQHTTVSLHIKQKFPATQFLRSLRNTKVVDGWKLVLQFSFIQAPRFGKSSWQTCGRWGWDELKGSHLCAGDLGG